MTDIYRSEKRVGSIFLGQVVKAHDDNRKCVIVAIDDKSFTIRMYDDDGKAVEKMFKHSQSDVVVPYYSGYQNKFHSFTDRTSDDDLSGIFSFEITPVIRGKEFLSSIYQRLTPLGAIFAGGFVAWMIAPDTYSSGTRHIIADNPKRKDIDIFCRDAEQFDGIYDAILSSAFNLGGEKLSM